ncbi:MAG: NTP transferase domain-containing protein [Gammaproteobacteria bacterium]|nr:NTP transferase domain-containing protein [Gammaproteobacteria bacterium]
MKLQLALLAAGRASRYGGNKLLAVHPASQQPLLHHVIGEYRKAGITDIVVLTGHWHNAIYEALPTGVTHHYVVDWQEGMAASVRAAAALDLTGYEGLMVGLGDQAGISATLISSLITGYTSNPVITATDCQGIIGPPVIFPPQSLTVLNQLQGDSGAGKYLRKLALVSPGSIQTQRVNSLTDIDYPADWHKLD